MNNAKQERNREVFPNLLLLLPGNMKNSHICTPMVGKETEIRCKDENRKITC